MTESGVHSRRADPVGQRNQPERVVSQAASPLLVSEQPVSERPVSEPRVPDPSAIPRSDEPATLVLTLVAAPGVAAAVSEALCGGLPEALTDLLPGARWEVRPVAAADLAPPLGLADVLDWARSRLLEEGSDLLVLLTDLPLRVGRRPLLAHASSTHSVAVVSLPALGPLQLNSKARRAVLAAVQALVDGNGQGRRPAGSTPSGRGGHRTRARVQRLVRRADRAESGVALAAYVVSGNLRLLAGMVRANRPWRLALHLSRALVASLAAAAFALVTSDVWTLADRLGGLRLGVMSVGAVGALAATLIIAADLWERSPIRSARQQVMLFNAATTAT
ncbi:MAG: hypothetical protein QOJ19_781, partial [Acidimicrobiia bacterium]|nr:hypothetical protein [Acidimicrobiia bacterium]